MQDLRSLLGNVSIDLTSEDIVAKLFQKKVIKDQNDSYPDVFRNFFSELANDPVENEIRLQLLMIVACKAVNKEKLEQLRILLCDAEEAKKKPRDATIQK